VRTAAQAMREVDSARLKTLDWACPKTTVFERSFLEAGRLIRAWMRVEMVSLGSERVSLRIGRVTFKIPCFSDLIAGSVHQ